MSRRHTRPLLAAIAALAVLGAVLISSGHTHDDGSPHGRDDCAICQISTGIAAGLVSLIAVLLVVLALLARLASHEEIALVEAIRLTHRARAPPLPA